MNVRIKMAQKMILKGFLIKTLTCSPVGVYDGRAKYSIHVSRGDAGVGGHDTGVSCHKHHCIALSLLPFCHW